ncbi:Nucleoporin NUP1 [Kluyveromyces marxianus]
MSVGISEKQKPKRSISSTLVSLFSKHSEDDGGSQFNKDDSPDDPGEVSDSGSVVIKGKKRRLGAYDNLVWNDEDLDNNSSSMNLANLDDDREADKRPSIFLYEGDSLGYDLRPPVLTIEPKQRLRLLRMQQLRRARQYPLLQRHLLSLEHDRSDYNYSYAHDHDHGLLTDGKPAASGRKHQLKSTTAASTSLKKNSAVKKSKTKRWRGDFQYDLSEYDILKNNVKAKQSSAATAGNMDSPKLSRALLKQSSSLKKPSSSASDQSETSVGSTLTGIQSKLLQGKSLFKENESNKKESAAAAAAAAAPLSLKPLVKESISEKKPLFVNAPSIGFDFVTSDTNSPDATDTPTKPAASRAFTFGGKPDTNAGANKVAPAQVSKRGDDDNDNDDIEELPRKKRELGTSEDKEVGSKTAASASAVAAPKPFSFGNPIAAKPSDTPKFSFGGASSNTSKLDPVVPSFSFGATKSSKDESKKELPTLFSKPSDDSSSKDKSVPKSGLVSTADKTENNSVGKTDSLFKFGAKSNSTKPDETTKQIPSFTFGKAKESTEEPQVANTAEISKTPKPLFQFGSTTSNDNEKQKDVVNNEVAVPTFSFGKTNENNKTESANTVNLSAEDRAKPAFSFGKPSSEATKATTPTFSFGKEAGAEAKATSGSDPSAIKPAFSFGSTTSQATQPSKPAFSFGSAPAATGANDQAKEKTPTFSFGGTATKKIETVTDNSATKPSFTFGTSAPTANGTNNTSTQGTPSFSFGASSANKPAETAATSKPSFSFGSTTVNDNKQNTAKPPVFGSQTQNEQKTSGGFKFDLSGLKNDNKQSSPTPFSDGSNVASAAGSNGSAGGFSFGNNTLQPTGQNNISAPQPSQSAFNFSAQQTQKPFAFGGSGPSTTNNSPAFGASSNQPNVPFTFGGSSASSTPQIQSLGSAGFPNPGPSAVPSTQSFNPSNVVNFNFAGQQPQNPSTIFGSPAPQGNSPSMFSSGAQNPASIFNSQPVGTPQGNPQFPPQRKIAMPSRRRRRA